LNKVSKKEKKQNLVDVFRKIRDRLEELLHEKEASEKQNEKLLMPS